MYEYDAINITLGLPFIRITPDHVLMKKWWAKIFNHLAIQLIFWKSWLKQKSLGQNFLVDSNILEKLQI